MNKPLLSFISVFMIFFVSSAFAAPLLDSNEIGFNGQTRSDNYDTLVNKMFSDGRVVTSIGNMMWVPWFKTSSSSKESDLQSGQNCNSGQAIDFTHNCMVTDEFSQVGILVSMGKNAQRMEQFYNSVVAIKSTNGNLPAWRVYRNGDTIEPCKQGINGNCDTASDGSARIITALYTASKSDYFTSEQKSKYASLAKILSDDFLNYEVDKTCRKSNLGYGDICHWLAGGSEVKRSGISSNDYTYTGYYPDAIIAMLQAYAATNDEKYLRAAKDINLNYLQASNFNGNTFSVPAGKSFKWIVDSNGVPKSQCTGYCESWDDADASRALGMCQANYYSKEMGVELSGLNKYCADWGLKYMTNPNSAPIQYYPDAKPVNYQSGYFAQGLQSLLLSGYNSQIYKQALDSALSHYVPSTGTFDYSPAFGVYTQAFAVRSLGMGIGRDAKSFANTLVVAPVPAPTPDPVPAPSNTTVCTTKNVTSTTTTNTIITDIAKMSKTCKADGANCAVKSDTTSGVCRTMVFSTAKGDIKTFACKKDNNYVELYRQAAPLAISWTACLANGCVSSGNGFLRFLPKETVSATTTTQITSCTNTSTVASPAPLPVLAPAPTVGVASLIKSCTIESTACSVKSDVTSGTCRTAVFGTSKGDIKIMGCEKTTGIEVYRQDYPIDTNFKACFGTGCVDRYGGFAKISS